jgi:hypothetical protein
MRNNILFWYAIALTCALGGVLGYLFWTNKSQQNTETTHRLVVQEISSLGKLELLRYTFKDVVEHEQKKQWLPNAKVLLIVSGEVVSCLDLTQIDSADIIQDTASVIVYLPEPEICYHKIDHSQSKVFNTEYTMWEEAKLIDAAYQQAETQILQSALKMNMLEKTKASAEKILRPLLSRLTQKPVQLRYRKKIQLSNPK